MAADTADEKTRYEAAKKELAQALKKKRELDKQLVRLIVNVYFTSFKLSPVCFRGPDISDRRCLLDRDVHSRRREHRPRLRQLLEESDGN
jgi:uncharacterized protein HemY